MDVEIRFYAQLRDAVGRKTVEREVEDGATLVDVLRDLASEFPALRESLFDDDGEVRSTLVVRRNREPVQAFDTVVTDGDTIALTPQIGGGRSGSTVR